MWSVRILSGPNAGQIFDLKLGKNIFGRGPSCDFKVQSVGISKEHCEIHVYKDKIIIVDLKSSNGTFINGVKIQNSIMHVGDKISLFDIIMDLIPAPDIRPKNNAKPALKSPRFQSPSISSVSVGSSQQNFPALYDKRPSALSENRPPALSDNRPLALPQYSSHGATAYQQQAQQVDNAPPEPAALTFQQKIEDFIENVIMPAVYRLALVFPFKQVLMGFVLLFVFGVTLLSVVPLSVIIRESNYTEATKRAKSVARAIAKFNEQALLSGQLASLSVQEALKEDGIKEALIIQQSDGHIVAPSEKVGRDFTRPFLLKVLKESRSNSQQVDSDTIGASFPIGTYDAVSGEPTVQYHAVVFYDVSTLNIDSGRMISLFMQTLIIASLLGLVLYFLFIRLVEFPLKSLNQQIDQALRDKTDRTEVAFDYPAIQQLTTNVNNLLNRVWNSSADSNSSKPQQNRDLEYKHLVEMITQPAIVIGPEQRIVALNQSFAQLCQVSELDFVEQNYQTLTDSSLVQNIESLITRSQKLPYEKHTDRIPFSQFECDIQCQAFLDEKGEPQYYMMTLTKAENPT